MLAGLFPRLAFAIYWIARPGVIETVFGGMLIWPFLGMIFLPFTTLMYVLLWSVSGLAGFDWLWVGIALLFDIGHYSYSAYGNRDRIPGMGTRV
jgi:hypothetical protein